MKGRLLFEDGSLFLGTSFGYEGVSGGEVVFNTAMTGYQEILTDPSYAGQIVTMTYPEIGNYGVCDQDVESGRVYASGFIVREYIDAYSNWRARSSLGEYLRTHKIVALSGIDTRAVTRRIRERGALRAIISGAETSNDELHKALERVPSMEGRSLTQDVACRESYSWDLASNGKKVHGANGHVVVVDCGVKFNILRRLVDEGAKVTVVPPTLSARELLQLKPDGILISNGPGDPSANPALPAAIRECFGKVPLFGICLGHQVLGLALGAKTYKLRFGHHGANHPVRDERSGRIEITSQNHGFAVDGESLARISGKAFGEVKVTHVHLSDGTIEGFEVREIGVKAIQYHPEASPGPHDASYLFEEFLSWIKKSSKKS